MKAGRALLIAAGLLLPACMHPLQVRNLAYYATSSPVGDPAVRPRLAVRPFAGRPEDSFYYFAVVQQARYDPYVSVVELDANPDFVVTVEPAVEYRSSIWNLPIMFPGFIVFAPAWNGYEYSAVIDTRIQVEDASGARLGGDALRVHYDLRHADVDRTALANIGWFIVTSPITLGAGIYDALVFDPSIVGGVQAYVRENYGRHVYRHIAEAMRPDRR